MSLHYKLLQLKEEVRIGLHLEGMGICNQLGLSCYEAEQLGELLVDNYGCVSYVVEHPSLDRVDAYNFTDDLWDTEQPDPDAREYARNRRDMLDNLIELTRPC